MKEALYYTKQKNKTIQCYLCPHNCVIKKGKHGICGVRKNIDGKLITENYGKICSLSFDPIEKKPLYHFHPSKIILSVGSVGCNFSCQFCQNWQIAQTTVEDYPYLRNSTPGEIVREAKKNPNNFGIAYTYNEPTVWTEFMLDIAKQAQQNGLKNVVVTNGFINKEPLGDLIKYVDAFSVDLKAYTNEFYKTLVNAKLEPVKETIKQISEAGKFLEITNLIIPQENDNPEDFAKMIDWLSTEIDEDTVLHLSRYFPMHKFTRPETPVSTLDKFYAIAKEKLNYVYVGNVVTQEGQNTYCKKCGTLAIKRNRYFVNLENIDNEGCCTQCGEQIVIL